jgi:hypothetical protein
MTVLLGCAAGPLDDAGSRIYLDAKIIENILASR